MARKKLYEILIVLAVIALILVPQLRGGVAYEMADDGLPVPGVDISELKKPGIRIAALTGSELVNAAADNFPEAEILQYDSFSDMFYALSMGKADAAMAYITQSASLSETYPNLTYIRDKVADYTFGFGAQKNESGDRLIAQMDEWLTKISESGWYRETEDKWNQSGGAQVMGEYSFTGENGPLRIATPGTWTPMSFYAGDELTGFFIELMNAFCQEYGYTPVYSSMPYASEIAGLNAGEFDLLADSIVRLPDRLEIINISVPLLTSDVFAYVPALRSAGAGGALNLFGAFASSFERNFIRQDGWRILLSGFGVTLGLSALSVLFGTLLGGLICFLRTRKSALANAAADLYIRVFRGVPIVVLLLVLNYLVFTGADFPAFWVCVVAFSLDFAAYASEIFRNGIDAVPPGQARAARALGFGPFHAFRRVVFPQALTRILPVYSGQLISTVKLTSVAGYISVIDLTRASDIIRSRTFDAFLPLITTALVYFLLYLLLMALLQRLEARIQPRRRNTAQLESLVKAWSAGGAPSMAPDEGAAPQAGAPGEVLFHVAHLKKRYGDVQPISDISCDIRRGEVIAIIGPSGTGKSTFINTLNQLETADGGEIAFEGGDILARGYDLNGLRRRVGMVFQQFNLFQHLTVVENVMLAQTELLGRSESDALSHSMAMLQSVGLADKALSYPAELSGGQQQRVAIARAVAMDPDMILFDEPTSALDPTTIGEVLSVIRSLARKGMTMMIVTHEMKFARDVSTRVFYLDQGVVYEQGSPEQIFDAPQKERTRQFIQRLKVLRIKIEGARFDYAGAVSEIEAFGHRNVIDYAVVYRMITLTEELGVAILLAHYGERADIEIAFEYREDTGEVHMRARFAGDEFDPLAGGDALSFALIRDAARDIKYTRNENAGTVECAVNERKRA